MLFDDGCSFCRWSLARVLAWDREKRLRPVAIQSPEGASLLAGLEPGRRLDSWHLITADGRLFSAGAAAAPLARVLPFGPPLAALLAAFPRVTEHGYRFVARHRSRWGRLLRIDPPPRSEARR